MFQFRKLVGSGLNPLPVLTILAQRQTLQLVRPQTLITNVTTHHKVLLLSVQCYFQILVISKQ